jgi:hypothetical protein
VLAGWLFTSTRYATAKLVRGERRRHAREVEAQLMQEITQDDPAAHLDWERVRPVLDEVIGELGDHATSQPRLPPHRTCATRG